MKFFSKFRKKIIVGMLIICFVTMMSTSAFAIGSDVYHKLMNGDSQQSALLLAELGETDASMEASSNIKILRCVNGSVDTFSTKLNKIDNVNNDYSAGDKVLVSVSKRFFGGYDVALFMKEVSVSDEGVVTFSEEEYTPDLFALEWYVNTGEKDFVFDGNESKTVVKVYVNKTESADVEKAKRELIYSQTEEGKIDIKRLEEPYLSHKNNVLIIEKFYYKHKVLLIVICFIALAALIAFRVWFGFYMRKRNKVNNSITDQ